MDFIGVNLYIGSSFLPMALLLFPEGPGQLFAALLAIGTGWNCIDVWNSWYSISQPTLAIYLYVLFSTYVWTTMTWFEMTMFYAAIGLLKVGSTLLMYEGKSSFSREVLFEMYHLISVFGCAAVLCMNYSILKRKA